MDWLILVYVFGIIILAGFLQTLTGSGFALVAAPLLTFATGPKEAVILVLLIGLIMKLFMVYKTWHEGDFSRILPIFIASVIGTLPGVYVLKFAGDSTLKILIGITMVFASIAMCYDKSITIRRHGLAKSVTGLMSGFFGATTSLSGPPIVFYMMLQGEEKVSMRANLVRYFSLGNAITLLMAYFVGLPAVNHLTEYILASIPAVFLGWYFGEKLFANVDASLFRRISLAVISVSALVTICSGIYPFASKFITHS